MEEWINVSRLEEWINVSRLEGWINVSRLEEWINVSRLEVGCGFWVGAKEEEEAEKAEEEQTQALERGRAPGNNKKKYVWIGSFAFKK